MRLAFTIRLSKKISYSLYNNANTNSLIDVDYCLYPRWYSPFYWAIILISFTSKMVLAFLEMFQDIWEDFQINYTTSTTLPKSIIGKTTNKTLRKHIMLQEFREIK